MKKPRYSKPLRISSFVVGAAYLLLHYRIMGPLIKGTLIDALTVILISSPGVVVITVGLLDANVFEGKIPLVERVLATLSITTIYLVILFT